MYLLRTLSQKWGPWRSELSLLSSALSVPWGFRRHHMQKPTRPACLFLLGPCHTPHQLLAFHTHPGLSLWFSSSIGSYRKKMMSFHVPGNGPYVPSRLLVPATASSLSSGPSLYRLTLLFSPSIVFRGDGTVFVKQDHGGHGCHRAFQS